MGQGELPDKVEVTEVIASSSSGFFMEGCTSVVYRLEPATADMLIKQGLTFFDGVESPRKSNPYSQWRETPIPDPDSKRILALRAVGGCDGTGNDSSARGIREAMQAPGSFYAITSNNEGMIFIAPRARLAAFFYLG